MKGELLTCTHSVNHAEMLSVYENSAVVVSEASDYKCRYTETLFEIMQKRSAVIFFRNHIF
jgi:hypothetical protein